MSHDFGRSSVDPICSVLLNFQIRTGYLRLCEWIRTTAPQSKNIAPDHDPHTTHSLFPSKSPPRAFNLGIIAPKVAREDAKFFAVFGDGAAGDGDAFSLKFGDQFLVTEGAAFVFDGDEVGDHFFDAGIRDGGAAFGLVAGGEKVFKIKNPVRGFKVFVGDGAADRGFMHADDVSDLGHGKRLKFGDPFFKET